ncbi:alpha/beta hydrolase [Croceicoccus ponticola]|uniref:alpha/beta hydrolase n=1 Tax=Croceicoccus ponticola TaxID=2217664 RepID=UPI0013E37C50|nr:alpha/beta hydrolase [Croceicoccus ponticola]
MKTVKDRIDPELVPAYPEKSAEVFALITKDIGAARAAGRERLDDVKSGQYPFGGTTELRTVPGLDADPEVPIVIYRDPKAVSPESVLVWLHGGGYVLGSAHDPWAFRYTPLMTVVSVEYRLAPEHRSPSAPRDACAVLEWLAANASELGLDRSRIVIGGPSGGGGVAAGAALLNRDRGGPPLRYQLLIYPMIDDTHETESGRLDLPPGLWTREVSLDAWSVYTEETGTSRYAAAARAENVQGLPPAYIMTGDLDLFRDECIQYASRLMAAGVPVDLAVFPGAPHGFDLLAPDAAVSRRAIDHQLNALRQVLI